MNVFRKYYAAGWFCLFIGYQILTFTLFYGLYDLYAGHTGNFWLGHVVTSIVLVINGLILLYMVRQRPADILYCLSLLVTGAGSFILMIFLRIVTIVTPFWITVFFYCLAIMLSAIFMLLAFAGAEYSLRKRKEEDDEMQQL